MVLNSVATLTRASGVEHTVVDVSSLPGCGEVCLEAMLQVWFPHLEQFAKLTTDWEKSAASLQGENDFRQTWLAIKAE